MYEEESELVCEKDGAEVDAEHCLSCPSFHPVDGRCCHPEEATVAVGRRFCQLQGMHVEFKTCFSCSWYNPFWKRCSYRAVNAGLRRWGGFGRKQSRGSKRGYRKKSVEGINLEERPGYQEETVDELMPLSGEGERAWRPANIPASPSMEGEGGQEGGGPKQEDDTSTVLDALESSMENMVEPCSPDLLGLLETSMESGVDFPGKIQDTPINLPEWYPLDATNQGLAPEPGADIYDVLSHNEWDPVSDPMEREREDAWRSLDTLGDPFRHI